MYIYIYMGTTWELNQFIAGGAPHCSKMGGDGDWTQGIVLGRLTFWFKDALAEFYQTSLDISL